MSLSIGISGASCTGKGYLCRRLAQYFIPPAVIVPMDSYYRDLSLLPADEREKRNFDCPQAIEKNLLLDHLRGLLGGEEVVMPDYDFRTHTRVERAGRMPSRGETVLLEGLFAFYWKELREATQFKVFIELEPEKCLLRRIERDTRERGRTVETVLHQFRSRALPMYQRYVAGTKRYADLVVRGDAPHEETVDRILVALRKHGQARFLDEEKLAPGEFVFLPGSGAGGERMIRHADHGSE